MNLKKIAIGTAVASVLSVGLIGFAHTEAGRPLLNALRGAPGCPVDLDGANPGAVEAYRVRALEARQGTAAPRSHYALGFELGKTRRGDVETWARAHAQRCEPIRQGSALRCSPMSVSAASAPAIDDLHLQFDGDGRLVAVDLFRTGTRAEHALAHVRTLAAELGEKVGPSTRTSGRLDDAGHLGQKAYRRTAVEYRYRGYVAEVSAMNFGNRGVRVREKYQSL